MLCHEALSCTMRDVVWSSVMALLLLEQRHVPLIANGIKWWKMNLDEFGNLLRSDKSKKNHWVNTCDWCPRQMWMWTHEISRLKDYSEM